VRPSKMFITFVTFLALGLYGCPEKDGPAESAGEKLDDAAESIGDAINPKGPAEKAGEKVDEALGND
jgi:hypothetical protein